jgi:hypothetical protein
MTTLPRATPSAAPPTEMALAAAQGQGNPGLAPQDLAP